ncbi:acetyltransferase [Arcobacter caeni]|uniref:Acetyltransferase n=1 Tax=Arcobacter caeni TaxID=1912877 RepID=A0A363CY55_9BACT|nr:acetyltransferase [Arcobacter caeni]PUE63747.1 acetyltransferase [Arcobacter caeni]
MKSIYIYGASGHGLVVADIAKLCGYEKIIFVDDGKNIYPSFEDIKENNHIPIAFGVGNNTIRSKLFEKAKNCDFKIVTLIHPNSVISSSVSIGEGTVVMPNVAINANAIIGNAVILNTSSIIEHECKIDDYVHISPNVALGGAVKVGKYTHIGIGSNIIQCIIIGENVIVGAGSTVVRNVSDFKKAYGNPCKVKDINE